MKKEVKVRSGIIIVLIFTLFFLTSVSAQLTNTYTLSKTPCSSDRDCSKLDHVVTLPPEEQICYDKIKYFTGNESIFYSYQGYNTGEMRNLNFLIGKQYTDYLQLGYIVKHKCSKNGFCEEYEKDPYAEGQYKKCKYGCLVTPTYHKKEFEEKGKYYSNFCICDEGRVKGTEAFCDNSKGNNIYYKFNTWTCEEEVKTGMICGIGGQCSIKNGQIGCWPAKTNSTSAYDNQETQYAMIIPSMTKPVMVAAIQNGKIIASKPISNLSAEQYILKNGPVHASQATYFAQATGLTTTIANTQNKTITPNNTSITTAYTSYNSYTPRTINTYTYKPNWNSYTNTTRTNTYTPNHYSNYYTRTYTSRTSYTPYTSTRKTTRAYNPKYYSNYYTARKTYTPKTSYTYKPTNTYTRTTSYTYTPRANYTSRTFTRNTYTPTTNNTRTYSYTPKTTYNTYTRTYSYKPKTTNTYTYKPNTTTTNTTYSRYYKRTYT